jgi:hypothetical protein
MTNVTNDAWLKALKARGLGGVLETALDALEPLGPLGAQLLLMTQPVAWVLGGRGLSAAARGLAEALETPEGIAAIRRALEETSEGNGSTPHRD